MAIQTHDLVVRFPGKREPTLKGISLTIPDGTFSVLVGASGSGKSTLLHCLAGLITATTGSVTDGGETVTEPHPRRGVAFQRDVLFPWMTVADNIDFALTARRLSKPARRDKIHELLDLVGLRDEVAAQRPGELSGGMRQRVSASSAAKGSSISITAGSPASTRAILTRLRMQDLLIDLWTRLNRTIVFVTHDIDEAIRLADTVSVLRDGQIVERITNPLARPRPADALADQPGYSEIRKTLHHQLGIDHAVH